jgi:hypothetical protein
MPSNDSRATPVFDDCRDTGEAESARTARRWPTPEHFYQERDDRTARQVGNITSYVHCPVEILVDPAAASDATVQRITLVAANLTARWARKVRVVMSNDASLVSPLMRDGAKTLASRVVSEMRSADPFGDFSVGESGYTEADSPLRLFVGPWSQTAPEMAPNDYHVHAMWWTALGRRCGNGLTSSTGDTRRAATAAAAGLAAALGAADLFKRAINHSPERWMPTFAWDTWSNELALETSAWSSVIPRVVAPSLDLGRMLVAGVGAVGSAFVYLADLMAISGELTVFDRDRVDATNLNRSPLFTAQHAIDAVEKTEVVAEYLRKRGLIVAAQTGEWRESAAAFAAQSFDAWVSLTNEDGAWAELPFQLPPVVFHGTTTSGWGFSAGRHIPGREDCTLCRMPRPSAEFRGPCAEGEIPSEAATAEPIRASLPFLSTAAAALLLGAYEQLAYSPAPASSPNDVSADLGGGLRAVIALRRGPTPNCRGCAALASSAWRRKWPRGRFVRFSS